MTGLSIGLPPFAPQHMGTVGISISSSAVLHNQTPQTDSIATRAPPLKLMSPIKNVAIVGAGGHVGQYIVDGLVKQGKHTVTAITRPDSTSAMPSGLHAVKKADYSNHDSLVEALGGQDFLIITMGHMAEKGSQQKLVDAAKDAGVKYIMPNEWGVDHALNEQMGRDTMLGPALQAAREYIEKAGLTWIALSCSFCTSMSLRTCLTSQAADNYRVRVQPVGC